MYEWEECIPDNGFLMYDLCSCTSMDGLRRFAQCELAFSFAATHAKLSGRSVRLHGRRVSDVGAVRTR